MPGLPQHHADQNPLVFVHVLYISRIQDFQNATTFPILPCRVPLVKLLNHAVSEKSIL